MNIGTNLSGMVDWETTAAYIDIFKEMRQWGQLGHTWDEIPNIAKTPDGWPLQPTGCLTFGYCRPNGIHQFSYDGNGQVKFTMQGVEISPLNVNKVGNTTTGQLDITWHSESGLLFEVSILQTDTSNPIRNIKIVHQSNLNKQSQVFTDEFLNSLKPYSTIRFMDWTRTNDVATGAGDWYKAPPRSWNDRSKLTDPFRTQRNGVPWEDCITLCNALNKDAWINIPDTATQDYVDNCANLFASTLNRNLNVYTEFSNETWNGGFSQFHRVLEDSVNNPDLLTPAAQDQYHRMMEHIAWKAKWCGQSFMRAFGEGTPNGRVRPLISGQAANTYWIDMGLEYVVKKYGPPANFFYGTATAPYLALYDDSVLVPGYTLDQLFTNLNGQYDKYVKPWIVAAANQARKYNIKFTAYECGIGVTDMINGQKVNSDTNRIAQNDPRIGDLYRRFWGDWSAQGGGLTNYFGHIGAWSQWGYWGIKEKLTDPDGVKAKTILSLIGVPQPSSSSSVSSASSSSASSSSVSSGVPVGKKVKAVDVFADGVKTTVSNGKVMKVVVGFTDGTSQTIQ